MWSECKKPSGRSKKQLLIEGDELSDEDRKPAYDEGGEEEDDFLLFRDRGEALFERACLLPKRRRKIESGPISFISTVSLKKGL